MRSEFTHFNVWEVNFNEKLYKPELKSEISGGGRILSVAGFGFCFLAAVRNDINWKKRRISKFFFNFQMNQLELDYFLLCLRWKIFESRVLNVKKKIHLKKPVLKYIPCCLVQHHVPIERPNHDFFCPSRWRVDTRCYSLAPAVDGRVLLWLERILRYLLIARNVWPDNRSDLGMDEFPIYQCDKHFNLKKKL